MRRRLFMLSGACTLAPLVVGAPVFAQGREREPLGATAITQVFGDGARLIAVALEYDAPVRASELAAADFHVRGRTVTGVGTSVSAKPSDRSAEGRFVIVELSPDDANAGLARKAQGGKQRGNRDRNRGPGNAGEVPPFDTRYPAPSARVTVPGSAPITTTRVENLVVDDFHSLQFDDPRTGRKLRYNLFVPKGYGDGKSYPLVLFMHDAGATSDVTRTTLFQGLGAIAWAGPDDQAARPCFVLAPQFDEIVADDDSRTSTLLDTTVHLVESLADQYDIDRNRLYATGQSGGCMLAIAMDIRYPGYFAASFLVAGQWSPALVEPLARQKLWILVSQDDDKAWPGQNAIAAVLEKDGAKVSRAVWDGTWSAKEFREAFEQVDSEGSPINYVAFRQGTVIPPGQSAAGAGGHRNTWRIAYSIEPIREWVFRQHL